MAQGPGWAGPLFESVRKWSFGDRAVVFPCHGSYLQMDSSSTFLNSSLRCPRPNRFPAAARAAAAAVAAEPAVM
jgi:hypothetical protein